MIFTLSPDIANYQYEAPKITAASYLVGGFNPFEKYARQIGAFPQIEVKIKKNIWSFTTYPWTLNATLKCCARHLTVSNCSFWSSWHFDTGAAWHTQLGIHAGNISQNGILVDVCSMIVVVIIVTIVILIVIIYRKQMVMKIIVWVLVRAIAIVIGIA